jgi:hypothetical protein
VAPHTDAEVVGWAAGEAIPGCLTATEIVTAWQGGASAAKLFPAEPLGPGYLRSLRAPLPHIPIVPTGGIDAANVRAYLAAADGLGGSLVGDGDADGSRRRAAKSPGGDLRITDITDAGLVTVGETMALLISTEVGTAPPRGRHRPGRRGECVRCGYLVSLLEQQSPGGPHGARRHHGRVRRHWEEATGRHCRTAATCHSSTRGSMSAAERRRCAMKGACNATSADG